MDVLVTVLFLAAIVQTILERVRSRWTNLDGDLVFVAAVVLSYGLAVVFDLTAAADLGFAGLPVVLDLLATAIFIAGGAGLLASWKDSNRATIPTSSLYVPPVVVEDSGTVIVD